MKPKPGMKFDHARKIDPDYPVAHRKPDRCEVTAVRKGTVYYRTVKGMKMRTPLAKFAEIVGKVITPFHEEQE